MKIKMYERDGTVSPKPQAPGAAAQEACGREAEVFVLCAGRHPLPEGLEGRADYIYHYIGDPMDFAALEAAAGRALAKVERGDAVYIYVTGLTSALVAALNALREKGCAVTLMHFDRRELSYKPQAVN